MMNTMVWPLSETLAVVNQLSWKEAPEASTTYNTEQRLFDTLEIELSKLSETCDNAARLVSSLSLATKFKVLRHPYIAGHLRSDIKFKLENSEFLYYLADAVLTTSDISKNWNHTLDSNINGFENQLRLTIKSPIRKDFSFSVFDYNRKLPIPQIDDRGSWIASLDHNSAKIVATKFEEALWNLSQISKSAFSFVESYMWYLAVRINIEKPTSFESFTFQELPGLSLICNPQIDSVGVYLIEETLLHEAIHLFLDWIEDKSTGMLRQDDIQDKHIISPWTGNLLDAHTAIHAVLVWHGLGEYFKAGLEASINPSHTARCRNRYQFVEQGFRSSLFVNFYQKLIALCTEHSASILRMVCEDYWAAV